QRNRFLLRNDIGKFKECRLENGVDPSAQTDFLTDLDTVDHIEFNVVLCHEFLHLSGKMSLDTFHIPGTVQQECAAINQFLNHVVFVNIGRVMASYKVCLMNQVSSFNRFLSETQV